MLIFSVAKYKIQMISDASYCHCVCYAFFTLCNFNNTEWAKKWPNCFCVKFDEVL